MSDIVERLRCPVRYGNETQDQAKMRHYKERHEAAETIESLRQQLAEKDAVISRLQFALADTEALELGTAERLAASQAREQQLREALEITHDLYAQSTSGYGFYRPANPHNFSPDLDCCSHDEIAAHSKACEDYKSGRAYGNDSWGIGAYCDEYLPALDALALPSDTTALEAMISKAGEVMRERSKRACEKRAEDRFNECGTREDDTGACYYSGRHGEVLSAMDEEDDDCANAIRALPGVTLEDLQK